jgi:hypothetical protein
MHLAMKYSTLIIFIFWLTVAGTETSVAQPVREGVQIKTDSSITLLQLKNPSLLNLTQLAVKKRAQRMFAASSPASLNKTTKLLLKVGTNLLRGANDNYPIYSLEKAWQYPGPTVQYPETATEYELFLRKYNRYNTDSK